MAAAAAAAAADSTASAAAQPAAAAAAAAAALAAASVRDDDDASDLHCTPFLGRHLVVENTSTGDDPEDGSRTGGWMWPASFVMLRFLETLLPALARADAATASAATDPSETDQTETAEAAAAAAATAAAAAPPPPPAPATAAAALRAWMQMPRAPRSVLDFSAGPGLLGIAAGVALGAQVGVPAVPAALSEGQEGQGGEEETSEQPQPPPQQQQAPPSLRRPPRPAEVHLTDFGRAQLALMRHNCTANGVRATVSELRWGSSAAELKSFPAAGNGGVGGGGGGGSGAAELAAGSEAPAEQGQRRFFDLVVCSDCLFIACRDDLRSEFVRTLLSLVGPGTVVLLGYTPRRPDEPDLVRALAEQGDLEVREVPPELLDFRDLRADVEEDGLFASMFHVVPEVKLFRLSRRRCEDDSSRRPQ